MHKIGVVVVRRRTFRSKYLDWLDWGGWELPTS